ncbi:hypothetical protein X943_001412 [Babesia divergens]|uniref:Uncharacterized protein n=1 Tax=Babesia divergens TaxID=32595 RepID=A0AAD9LMB2_BABDI|nr:hypothetical protein X943_001412 [Babesia divergens]
MSDLSGLMADLVILSDTLRAVVNVQNMLCIYLREVYTLVDLVVSDYDDLQKPSKDMTERLAQWRSLERSIFYALRNHSETRFLPYTHHEAIFMDKLQKSAETLTVKRDCTVKLKAHRFKEGIIAVKCAAEAKRRSTSIAEFIGDVKKITHRDIGDYLDNMVILHAFTMWTKEVVKDCVRSTSSSSEKFTTEESNGQTIYANEVIRGIVSCVEDSTVLPQGPKASRRTQLVEHMLDRSLLDDYNDMPSNQFRGLNVSHITYYLYNLVHNLQSKDRFAAGKLKPFLKAIDGLDVPLSIPTSYHLYQVQEYFSNLAKSNEFIELIHNTQQMLLKNVSVRFASEIYHCIERVLSKEDLGNLDIRPILLALRATKYLSDPDRRLLGIWDKPPFLT